MIKGTDHVYLRSREINNKAVCFKVRKIYSKKIKEGDNRQRWHSRTYTFRNFVAAVPYSVARKVVGNKENEGNFRIIGPVDKTNVELQQKIDKENTVSFDWVSASKEKTEMPCPFCEKSFLGWKGLMIHICSQHKDKKDEWLKSEYKKEQREFNELENENDNELLSLIKEKEGATDVDAKKKEEKFIQDKMAELPDELDEEEKRRKAEIMLSGMINKCC